MEAVARQYESAAGAAGVVEEETDGVPLSKLREWFQSYQDLKQAEMDEQRLSRRYYHGSQWTAEEREKLRERGQPDIHVNRTQRKIDGIVGLVERLRQDPKAYPRTPAHSEGAELATAALRFVFDHNNWASMSSLIAHDLAVSGLGGVEFAFEPVDDQSQDPTMERVAPETFFYDPRSVKYDFSDARFMGVAKWMDLDEAIELAPESEQILRSAMDAHGNEGDALGLRDWEKIWYDTRRDRVKIVEMWYRWRGQWHFCVHAGHAKLAYGPSPLKNEKGETLCRYRMSSGLVDHDGDRYGFVRNLKPLQDEINHRRSSLLHWLHSYRVIATEGVVKDVEKTKRELVKKNAWVELTTQSPVDRFEIMDKQVELRGHAELMTMSMEEIETFGGANPSLAGGQGQENRSGRAIALLQQAGIAELGGWFVAFKAWKLACYRMAWNMVREGWKGPRYIRITDNENDLQLVQVNQPLQTEMGHPAIDPMTGRPQVANPIGQLDVDIILDEGPDTVTLREDVLEDISNMMAKGIPIPPQVYFELWNGPSDVKQRILAMLQPQQDDPRAAQMQAAQQELAMRDAQATVRGKEASAARDEASAFKTGIEGRVAALGPALEREQMARQNQQQYAQ